MMRIVEIFLLCLLSLTSVTVAADVKEIGNERLEQLRSEGVAIIDVRRPDEWKATGLVEGSHRLTFFDADGRYDIEAWLSGLDAVVKPDQPVVLICASGVRSSQIASFLDKKLGFSDVHNVSKGINGWINEKRAVVPDKP